MKVLIAEDDAISRRLLQSYLGRWGHEVAAAQNGAEAWGFFETGEFPLVITDWMMPEMDGLELVRRIRAGEQSGYTYVILLTAKSQKEDLVEGMEAGADDFLTKPFDSKELLVRAKVLLRDRELNKRLDATESVLRAIARSIEARDRYTIHHADRVGRYSQRIGIAYGLEGRDLETLYIGGVLHDLGKIAVPDAILLKPGALTEAEYVTMQKHSEAGENICRSLRSVSAFLPIVRHHHERFDGAGYPDHLSRADIPIGARIAAIADAWDAMISTRPYRPALSRDEALARLRRGSGTQWDPIFVEPFLALVEQGAIAEIEAQYTDAVAW